MKKIEVLRELELLHSRLQTAIDALRGDLLDNIPEQSVTRFENGLCVYCGEPVPEGTKIRRGCDEKCHRKVDRRIKSGAFTDAQAISRGYWMPDGYAKTGRPFSVDPPVASTKKKSSKKASKKTS